ncbi:MAG: LON peptidase substrate-binding domain-containing protein [Roseiflexaceae bacterium]|nr:LON peptidase substrate-binding domain-containing protein [Roseiflexus sp.]MDW8215365.1 LON peptidase substrate-binding domain-containing protein [Roseiflexaceae bacterium]
MTDVSDNLPIELPLLILRGMVIFPPSVVPVAVSRPAAIRLVDDAVTAGGVIAVSAQRDDNPEQCYAIGASARVHRLVRLHDGTLRIALQALERIAIEQVTQRDPYLRALVRSLPDRTDDPDIAARAEEARERARELLDALPPNEELRTQLDSADDPRHLAALLASMCLVRANLAERQTLLEIADVGERLTRISALLTQELAILRGHLRM